MPDEQYEHEDCTAQHDDRVNPASPDGEYGGPQRDDSAVSRAWFAAILDKHGEHKKTLTLVAGLATTLVLATSILFGIIIATLRFLAVTLGPINITIGGGVSGALALTGLMTLRHLRNKRQKVAAMKQQWDDDFRSHWATPPLRVDSKRDEQGGG